MSWSKEEKLFRWMEDHDNHDLPDGAWQTLLEETIVEYNDDNGTMFDPVTMFLAYKKWINSNQDQ